MAIAVHDHIAASEMSDNDSNSEEEQDDTRKEYDDCGPADRNERMNDGVLNRLADSVVGAINEAVKPLTSNLTIPVGSKVNVNLHDGKGDAHGTVVAHTSDKYRATGYPVQQA